MAEPSQLSRSRRPKWHYVAMGVVLIGVAVALTVAWQILAAPDSVARGVGTARAVAYFFAVTEGISLVVLRRRDRQIPIPFGPYLAAAGLVALLWGEEINRSYLQLAGLG